MDKKYCKKFGEASLKDTDYIKLMEMNDNHVEYHTVKEFLTFCIDGPDAKGAGNWFSTFPGKYLEGGQEAGGQLVDQRLLPRIDEGEVRILMAGDTGQMAIHKKPLSGLSAVGGNSAYTYYEPEDWTKKENAGTYETEYVVGEFNCSCVGISKFQAVCGGEKSLADVPDEDYYDACRLTDLMGVKAIEMITAKKAGK